MAATTQEEGHSSPRFRGEGDRAKHGGGAYSSPAFAGEGDQPKAGGGAAAALIDVDGTLVDSNDLHAAAWAEAFRHFGFDIPEDRIRFQIGKGGDNLIPALLPDLPEEKVEEIDQYRGRLFKRDYLYRAKPFPGVRPLFERIAADGIALILASSSGRDDVDHYVELLGVKDLIRGSTSKDDVERSKPCPDIFEVALGKAGPVPKDQVRVVGDSPWDMKAAARLSLAAIGFRCGGFADADLEAAGVSALNDGPADLLRRYDNSDFAR